MASPIVRPFPAKNIAVVPVAKPPIQTTGKTTFMKKV